MPRPFVMGDLSGYGEPLPGAFGRTLTLVERAGVNTLVATDPIADARYKKIESRCGGTIVGRATFRHATRNPFNRGQEPGGKKSASTRALVAQTAASGRLSEQRERAARQTRGISDAAIYGAVLRAVGALRLRGTALDYGAGVGHLLRALHTLGGFAALTGAEPSPETAMRRRSRAKLAVHGWVDPGAAAPYWLGQSLIHRYASMFTVAVKE
jgi:hypothetical protein